MDGRANLDDADRVVPDRLRAHLTTPDLHEASASRGQLESPSVGPVTAAPANLDGNEDTERVGEQLLHQFWTVA